MTHSHSPHQNKLGAPPTTRIYPIPCGAGRETRETKRQDSALEAQRADKQKRTAPEKTTPVPLYTPKTAAGSIGRPLGVGLGSAHLPVEAGVDATHSPVG